MKCEYWIFVISLGLAVALNPVPHQTSEESLRSALNAVTRKQRSLNPQTYYEYRVDNGDRKFNDRQQVDDDNDELAFIPSEGIGQLETIGDGYQHLSNKQLGQALLDYLQYSDQQSQPSHSVFRERERSGSHKRGDNEGIVDNEDILGLFLEEMQNDSSDDSGQFDNQDHPTFSELFHEYRKKVIYELAKKFAQEQDQKSSEVSLPTAERRNVNARYPLFTRDFKNYQEISKRFPVSKRSASTADVKRQATDPKVAQDLGTLFGTQPTDTVNYTHNHKHDHDHDHGHEHDHDYSHGKDDALGKSKNLKEVVPKLSNNNKTKDRPIDVKKKSIDWSQYFGIDRRKKKAVYMAKPGTQDQDDQYLLQKYYEIMAENLNPSSGDKEGNAKRDKLQQLDAKLANMKNLMIEEAVQAGSKNDMNDQEVKDEIMSRLTAAYSYEKLRRALNDMRRDAAAHRQSQKTQNNLTNVSAKNQEKRNRDDIDELQDIEEEDDSEEEGNCPQLDIVERRCKATEALIGDFRQVLHAPCVMYHICNACSGEECLERFALETEKICQEDDPENSAASKKHCVQATMQLIRYPPAITSSALCRFQEQESCLIRYQNFNRQRPKIYSSRQRAGYDFSFSKR